MNKSTAEYYLDFIDQKATSRRVVLIALHASVGLGVASALLGYYGIFSLLGGLAVASGVLLILHSRGRYRAAAVGIATAVPVVATVLIVDGNGLNDPGVLAYAITVIFASLLLGRRSTIYFATLNAVLVAFAFWIERRGFLFTWVNDNPATASGFDLAVIETLLLIASYLVWVLIGYVEKNIAAVMRNEAEIRAEAVARAAELAEVQARLLEKERLASLGRLTAMVAHELRNPLGTVRNSVYAIGDAITLGQPEKIDDLRSIANRNIQRCDGIIDELLDYSRYHDIQLQTTRIGEWVEEILRQQSFPDTISWNREFVRGVKAEIDREALRRALVNILQNAVDALEAGDDKEATDHPEITVTVRVVAGRLEISVRDNGPGMDDEVAERMFEPFFSTRATGVGLGMPVVEGILQKHGGGVKVHSETGRGTTITLWLPIEQRETGGDAES